MMQKTREKSQIDASQEVDTLGAVGGQWEKVGGNEWLVAGC